MKGFLKTAVYTLAGAAVLAAAAGGISQTQFFRDYLRDTLLERLRTALHAEVQLGQLTGNLITGVSLDNISIKAGGDFVLGAERMDLSYDLFALPGNTLSLDRLVLVRPQVKLLRGKDGIWNFERMLKEGPAGAAQEEGLPWVILLNEVQLQEATVTLLDSTSAADADTGGTDRFHYDNFILQQFTFAGKARILPGDTRLTIDSLTFRVERPSIELLACSGDFRVTRDSAVVRDLRILTARSSLSLSASIKDVNLLGGLSLEALQHNPVRVSLRTRDLDLDELGLLLPPVGFLGGRAGLALEASGPFGELSVDRLDVAAGGSRMFLAGEVFNLHDPSRLTLDVHLTQGKVSGADAQAVLQGIPLPDLSGVGEVSLEADFRGMPTDFHARAEVGTEAGSVSAEGDLALGGEGAPSYDILMSWRGLDAGRITANPDLRSSLNGRASLRGRGTDPAHMAASIAVELDTSRFRGIPVRESRWAVSAADGHLEGDVDAGLGPMRASLRATVRMPDGGPGSFRCEGRVQSLDLAEILREKRFGSDLTVSFDASGRGTSWGDLTGDFDLAISPSRYADYRIDSGLVHLHLDQDHPDRKELSLASNIADFRLNGRFDLAYAAALLAFEAENIRAALGEKFSVLDTSYVPSVDRRDLERRYRELRARGETLDASFLVILKDLEPVSIVTGNRTFDGVGTIRGAITGDVEDVSMEGRLALEDFFYGNVDAGVLLGEVQASFTLTGLTPRDPLKKAEVRVDVHAPSMHVGRLQMDSTRVSVTYGQEYARYRAQARLDGNTSVLVSGLASLAHDRVLFTLNDLRAAYRE
ncbi:MAG: hypothetical protein WB626_01640, partial [Bacteroidota bacterium]